MGEYSQDNMTHYRHFDTQKGYREGYKKGVSDTKAEALKLQEPKGKEYVIHVTSESCDDHGIHRWPTKPSDQELEKYLRELGFDDNEDGPGLFGTCLHVEEVYIEDGTTPFPSEPTSASEPTRKSLAGPRARKLLAICMDAREQALMKGGFLVAAQLDHSRLQVPSWASHLQSVSVEDIESVLSALGVHNE